MTSFTLTRLMWSDLPLQRDDALASLSLSEGSSELQYGNTHRQLRTFDCFAAKWMLDWATEALWAVVFFHQETQTIPIFRLVRARTPTVKSRFFEDIFRTFQFIAGHSHLRGLCLGENFFGTAMTNSRAQRVSAAEVAATCC